MTEYLPVSLRDRIRTALREHQPPAHIDGLPWDEFDCCADAVVAAIEEWEDERDVEAARKSLAEPGENTPLEDVLADLLRDDIAATIYRDTGAEVPWTAILSEPEHEAVRLTFAGHADAVMEKAVGPELGRLRNEVADRDDEIARQASALDGAGQHIGEVIARAERAEAELGARTTTVAHLRNAIRDATGERDRLRQGLELIGTDCESFTGPSTCVDDPGRSPHSVYTADRWCDGCIARTALDGSGPPALVADLRAAVRAACEERDRLWGEVADRKHDFGVLAAASAETDTRLRVERDRLNTTLNTTLTSIRKLHWEHVKEHPYQLEGCSACSMGAALDLPEEGDHA